MAKLVLIWMSLSPYPKDGKQGLVVSEGLEHAFLRASSYGLWIRPLECLSLTSCSPFTTPNVLDPSLLLLISYSNTKPFGFLSIMDVVT